MRNRCCCGRRQQPRARPPDLFVSHRHQRHEGVAAAIHATGRGRHGSTRATTWCAARTATGIPALAPRLPAGVRADLPAALGQCEFRVALWTGPRPAAAGRFAADLNGQPNALFDNTRSSQTVTIPTNVAGSTVMANIYSETTFEIFGSAKPAAQNNTNQQWQIVPQPGRSKAGRTTACMAASAATWAPTCRRSIRSSGCTIATSIASGTAGIAWAAPTPATCCGAISRSTTSSACRRATPARRTTSRSPVCSTSSNSAIVTQFRSISRRSC